MAGVRTRCGILLGELLALDMLPPGVGVLDGQAHHEIAGVLLDVERLEQETELADLEFGNLVVAPIDGEAEISVELLGKLGVFGGDESLEVGYGTWRHWILRIGAYGRRVYYWSR